MVVHKNKICSSQFVPGNMESPYGVPVRLDVVKQKGLLDQNKDFTCANPPWGTDYKGLFPSNPELENTCVWIMSWKPYGKVNVQQ